VRRYVFDKLFSSVGGEYKTNSVLEELNAKTFAVIQEESC